MSICKEELGVAILDMEISQFLNLIKWSWRQCSEKIVKNG